MVPEIPPKPETGKFSSISPKSILLIDDEEAILEILTEMLEQYGHRVVAVVNAQTALEKLSSDTYDLMLCDMKMPGMSGQQFYSEVKKINTDLADRIIFATGDTVSRGTLEFLQNTRNRYIGKPFRLEELLMLINEFFEGDEDCAVDGYCA